MQMSQCFAWGGRMSRRVLGKKVSRTTAQQKVRMLQRLPWLPAFSYSSFPGDMLSPRHVMEALNGTSSLLKQPSKTTRKLGHSCFGKMVGGKETSLGHIHFFLFSDIRWLTISVHPCYALFHIVCYAGLGCCIILLFGQCFRATEVWLHFFGVAYMHGRSTAFQCLIGYVYGSFAMMPLLTPNHIRFCTKCWRFRRLPFGLITRNGIPRHCVVKSDVAAIKYFQYATVPRSMLFFNLRVVQHIFNATTYGLIPSVVVWVLITRVHGDTWNGLARKHSCSSKKVCVHKTPSTQHWGDVPNLGCSYSHCKACIPTIHM